MRLSHDDSVVLLLGQRWQTHSGPPSTYRGNYCVGLYISRKRLLSGTSRRGNATWICWLNHVAFTCYRRCTTAAKLVLTVLCAKAAYCTCTAKCLRCCSD